MQVISVNVGAIRELKWRGQTVRTGIWKHSVDGPVALRGVNFVGDDQADRTVHGGADKAVYAYSIEDYDYWAKHEAFDVGPAVFGENLTVKGMDLTGALVGDRWRVGTALLEVAQPRLPCFKLGIRVADPRFPQRFQSAIRPGAYLRIIEEGVIRAGDRVHVIERPAHAVTMGLMVESVRDEAKARAIQVAPRLPENWRAE
jgi:MOSC domain-containing protein YiiM